MSALSAAGMTAGSIERAGSYVLGAKKLTFGNNNFSTPVTGVISGVGGSLTKVGTGVVTLSNTETYTGATNGGDAHDRRGEAIAALEPRWIGENWIL